MQAPFPWRGGGTQLSSVSPFPSVWEQLVGLMRGVDVAAIEGWQDNEESRAVLP